MVSRHWTGLCKEGQSEAYIRHLKTETFPQLAGIPGFVRVSILTRRVEGGTEFQIVTVWRSRAAIEAFAGGAIERAVVPPFVERLMVRFDEQVAHYDVTDVFEPGREG